MTQTQVAAPPQKTQRANLGELLDRLSRFDGSPDEFLQKLLAVQCAAAGAAGAAIVHFSQEGRAEVLSAFPPQERGAGAPAWVGEGVKAAPGVMKAGRTRVHPVHGADQLYGQPASQHLVLLPIRGDSAVRGVIMYLMRSVEEHALSRATERLELTSSLLTIYEMRLSVQLHATDLARLRQTIEVHAVVNEHDRFRSAGMAMCNELATRWNARRVSLGVKRGKYVHLMAMSHTEQFTRKTQLGQSIETAMEECLDQDVEVIYPAPPQSPQINRAASELSQRHGPSNIVAVPLRRDREPTAVIVVERSADQDLTQEEVETLRLTCDLCAPRLLDLYEQDRWFGAKMVKASGKTAAALVGPQHTWAKLMMVAVISAVLFLVFAQGTYRVEAPFQVHAREHRMVVMPYRGYLEKVHVEPGDSVIAGQTVLAELDTTEQSILLSRAKADLSRALKERDQALSAGRITDGQIAEAQADQVRADIAMYEHQIAQATIVAPIDGVVLRGDLKRSVGSAVDLGTVLFEVGPLNEMYAELLVPDSEIGEVQASGGGTLAAASHPGEYLAFEVDRINPVADVVGQRNVFRVNVKLNETRDWVRPGMEGLAKLDLGKRHYAWMWTRDVVNWVRMKLWI